MNRLHGILLFVALAIGDCASKYDWPKEALGGDERLVCDEAIFAATRAENCWLLNPEVASIDSLLTLDCCDTDGIGVRTQLLDEQESLLITTYLPYYISVRGWNETPELPRRPMVSVRRKAKQTTFTALHQPYRLLDKPTCTLHREGEQLVVKGTTFINCYDLASGHFEREVVR